MEKLTRKRTLSDDDDDHDDENSDVIELDPMEPTVVYDNNDDDKDQNNEEDIFEPEPIRPGLLKKHKAVLSEEASENSIVPVQAASADSAAAVTIPRQWQLTDAAMITCLQAYVAWKMRLQSFVKLPVVYKGDDEETWQSRVDELRYLSRELLTIWSTGCSGARPLLNDIDEHGDEQQNGPNSQVVQSRSKGADPMAIAYCLFFHRIVEINLSPSAIDDAVVPLQDDLNELVSQHKKYDFYKSGPGPNESLTDVNNVLMAVQNAYRMLHHAASISIAIDPSKSGITPAKTVLYMVDNMNQFQKQMSEAKPQTRIILYLINVAAQRGYRRHGDGVYEQHVTPEGYPTSFWKRVCSMSEFIREHTSRERGGWAIFNETASRMSHGVKQLEEYLCAFYDPEFPFVFIDRHVFSFRNGIYFCATRTFRPYSEGGLDWGTDSHVKTRSDIGRENMARKRGIFGGPHVTNASANYFDIDFHDYAAQVRANNGSWLDIPTPTFEKLLEDQKIPLEAKKVVYGLVGRTFYEVGELDDWQIILWLLGRAGTGKSTICKIVQLFYQSEDVAVISNNIEEQFGLGAIYDKLVFMAPEVKKDFRLNQAEFQSMVSGEKMSIARKFKEAAGVMFKVPGIIAGNDMPAWMDNSDSLGRRIALVMCSVPVGKVDGRLSEKLRSEAAALICKVNLAYHMMLENYGNDGIWERLPAYFKNTQNQLKAKTHPMYHFLKSEKLYYQADRIIPLETFKKHFNDHCKQNNLRRVPWTEELYTVPLADYHLKIEKRKNVQWVDNVFAETTVIVGVTWIDECASQPQQGAMPVLGELMHKQQQQQQQQQQHARDGDSVPKFPHKAPEIGSYQAIPKNLSL